MDRTILVTGDYWNKEFRELVSRSDQITFSPFKQASLIDSDYALVVVAQSHPDQYSEREIEALRLHHGITPVIALLGSWCEGESRSGRPWPGIPRVYWHQWKGRYENFRACVSECRGNPVAFQGKSEERTAEKSGNHRDLQMSHENLHPWQAPGTSSVADRILRADSPHSVLHSNRMIVGVSANNGQQFSMLEDALKQVGLTAAWLELQTEKGGTRKRYDLICVDSNYLDEELKQRIQWIRTEFGGLPIIVIANFPRLHEVNDLTSLGVSHVVSKPFETNDLRYAVEAAVTRGMKMKE